MGFICTWRTVNEGWNAISIDKGNPLCFLGGNGTTTITSKEDYFVSCVVSRLENRRTKSK